MSSQKQMVSRTNQYERFLLMLCQLFLYSIRNKIPIRQGEAHRPFFVAQKYVVDGTGILNSKHRYSLAQDIWITDAGGKKILWKHPDYKKLGLYWESMGGTWGGRFKRKDVYHFEYGENPA